MFTELRAIAPPRALRPRAVAPRRIGRKLLGSGLLDALAAPHGVDRYLELVRPSWSLRDVRAEVTGVRRQTPGSVTLTLRPNANWRGFRAGQYVRCTVEIDGVRRTRCYSPASSAHATDGLLELTVKAHSDGLVSRFLNARAHRGMLVELGPAEGDFVLPAARPERLLLISGGSGITPVMSMLRTLCDEGHAGPVTFLHYAPSDRDSVYRAEAAELAARHGNVRVVPAYTRQAGAGELDGRLSDEQLRSIDPDYAGAHAYVCGPPGLIETARSLWAREGCAELVHSESFLPPTLTLQTAVGEGSVRFVRSGRRAPNSGRTLLEQAEAAGLSPEFGCRMGICHTCACRKTAGTVRNALNGESSSEEDEDIRICVSVPVGDVALEL